MLKKFYCFAILLTFILYPILAFAASQSEEITITTYYPSPVGSYHELQLAPYDPGASEPSSCVNGTMYYSSRLNMLRVCNNGTWGTALGSTGTGGLWQASVNASDASKIDISNTNNNDVIIKDSLKITSNSGENVALSSQGLLITTAPLGTSSWSLNGLAIFGRNVTITPGYDSSSTRFEGGNIEANSLTLIHTAGKMPDGSMLDKPSRIILGGSTLPTAGDVLTAKNPSGDVEWRAPGGGTGGGNLRFCWQGCGGSYPNDAGGTFYSGMINAYAPVPGGAMCMGSMKMMDASIGGGDVHLCSR